MIDEDQRSSGDVAAVSGTDATTARVKIVHAQARRALLLAAVFAVAAVVAAVVPHRTGAWLPLHLFLVGSVLLAISGATRLFAITWSAGQPTSGALVAVQRRLVATGAIGLALGRELGVPEALLALAGSCVTAGLALLGYLLVIEARTAVVGRFRPFVRHYLVAVVAGIVGTGLGAAMVTGRPELRDAHVIVNLLGLIGFVVAGTLPFFVATQARMKLSPRATPLRLHVSIGWLASTVAVAAAGAAAGHRFLVGLALAAYAAGLVHVATTLPRPGVKQFRWAGPRLAQLGLGLLWWTATVVAGAARALAGHDPFPEPLVIALVIGGYAQIVLASLAYLGPVLRGGGHRRLAAGFVATRSWVGVIAVNAAGLAWLAHERRIAVAALLVLAVDLVARVGLLAARRPVSERGDRPPGPSSGDVHV